MYVLIFSFTPLRQRFIFKFIKGNIITEAKAFNLKFRYIGGVWKLIIYNVSIMLNYLL